MTTTAIDLRKSRMQRFEPSDLKETVNLIPYLMKSGLMPQHIKTAEAATFIAMVGYDMGLSMMQAFRHLSVIQGKIQMEAVLAVSMIRTSGLCESWAPIESSATCCTIKTKRTDDAESVTMSYTIDDAHKMGLAGRDNYRKQPSTMLLHRCEMKIARAVYPEIMTGVYSPDEIQDVQQPAEKTVISMVEQQPAAPSRSETVLSMIQQQQDKRPGKSEPEPQELELTGQSTSLHDEFTASWKHAAELYGRAAVDELHEKCGFSTNMKTGWTDERKEDCMHMWSIVNTNGFPQAADVEKLKDMFKND